MPFPMGETEVHVHCRIGSLEIKAGMKVWTVDSFRRLAHVTKNKAERVYELELDDDSALFYANGFAVEPLTAKDKAANGKADKKEEK